MAYNNYTVIADNLRFPEGPAFANDGTLWAVELKGGCLVRYQEGRLSSFKVGGAPNGIAVGKDDMIWFCDSEQNSIRKLDPVTGITVTVSSHVDSLPLTKPNDLVFDSLEQLIFSCPGESRTEPTGYLCVRSGDGSLKKISCNKYFPNGLAFHPQSGQLVFAETYRHRLWISDWNAEDCQLTNQRVWCDTGGPEGPGGPDGMAFNSQGILFVAVYGTGKVKMINEKGRIFDEISLEGNNPTNCAFDPTGNLGLVITEAETGVLISLKCQQYNI